MNFMLELLSKIAMVQKIIHNIVEYMQLLFLLVGKWKFRSLDAPFSVEEVFSALSSLCGGKAPGQHAFTLAFWQHCWDHLGFFGEFYEQCSFERSLNATFIVIPKKQDAKDLKTLRLKLGCRSI